MDGQKQTYEQFKADILQWKDAHREETEKAIEQLVDGIRNSRFDLPNGVTTRIHVSGGIAWYPQDGEDLMELIKHADFAMYRVKNSTKEGACRTTYKKR